MEDERRYCFLCHHELDDDEDYEIDGEHLCENCYDEHTTTCDHCGEVIWANDAVNDAVYDRNRMMQTLYNCKIEVDSGGWDNGFNASVAAGLMIYEMIRLD